MRMMQKMFIRCSSGDKSHLGGDDGLRGTCKERILNGQVTDKERSDNGLCRISDGC